MNKVFASLSVLALAIALASPVAAQSITVKASVPFDFTVGARDLPAGDYTVNTLSATGVVTVRNESGSSDSSALTLSIAETKAGARGQVLLVFNRYGDRYFLSQVWDGSRSTGRIVPMSQTERELSQRASVQPESVMILARL